MSLDAIGIACKDIDLTIKFYELLGIKFTQLGDGHFESSLENGTRLMLDSFELLKKIDPNWKPPIQSGITLCFLQESPQLVDQLFKEVKANEFQTVKEPWDAFWGQRYCSVKDPNGNQIDLFAINT